jgi:hypothetical protein
VNNLHDMNKIPVDTRKRLLLISVNVHQSYLEPLASSALQCHAGDTTVICYSQAY